MSLGVTQQQNGVSTVPLYLSPLLDTGFHREELHRPELRYLRLILRESQVQADYGFPCQDIPPLHPSPSGGQSPRKEDGFPGMVTLTAGCRPLRARLPERTPSSQKEPIEMGSLVSENTFL